MDDVHTDSHEHSGKYFFGFGGLRAEYLIFRQILATLATPWVSGINFTKNIWGVNSDNDNYYGNGWYGVGNQIDGKLMQFLVSTNNKHIWGINSSDNIYYRHGVNGV